MKALAPSGPCGCIPRPDTSGTWAVYRWPLYDLLGEGRSEVHRGTHAECDRIATLYAERGCDVDLERVSDAPATPDRVVARLISIASADE